MVHEESAHLISAHKLHFDKQTLDRVESAIMLGLVGGGLAACVIGAVVYDLGRVFSIW